MAFVPISTTDGADFHGKMREVNLSALIPNTFLGDMMTIDPLGGPADGRAEGVAIAAVGLVDEYAADATPNPNALAGAIVEFTPNFNDEGTLIRNYHLLGTAQRGKLVYGSDVIYEAPDIAGDITVAEIGNNRSLGLGTGGDTLTGVSTHGIGVVAATPRLGQLRIIGYTNLEGDSATPAIGAVGAPWRCRINGGADDHRTAGA